MRKSFLKLGAVSLLTFFSNAVFATGFPMGPDERLTTGALCEQGNSLRYEERIEYCNRNVSSSKKWEIIDRYEELGYEIRSYGRDNFKIDHLIPLCAGGSNEESNLWPQHRTVYEQTDRIEEMSCRLMAQGTLTQDKAVALVLEAKKNLERASEIEVSMREQLGEQKLYFVSTH
jgi:hypothetical protein